MQGLQDFRNKIFWYDGATLHQDNSVNDVRSCRNFQNGCTSTGRLSLDDGNPETMMGDKLAVFPDSQDLGNRVSFRILQCKARMRENTSHKKQLVSDVSHLGVN